MLVLPLLAYMARMQDNLSPSPAGNFYVAVFPPIHTASPSTLHLSNTAEVGISSLSYPADYTDTADPDNTALLLDGTGVENSIQQQKVVAVYQGQILALANGHQVRLIGVNVPEKYQTDAQRVLTAAAAGRYVGLEICPVHPYDRDGRLRAVAYINGRNLNTTLIALGYSKVQVEEHCHVYYPGWLVYEQAAASQQRGLWRDY